MIATRPFSTKRKTHASAKHCQKPSVFKHVGRCACHDREACFNPYKILSSRTILPDRRPHPLGRRKKRPHQVCIGQKLVLHQHDTHLDQARNQSHSINAHKNSKQWEQTSLQNLSLHVVQIRAQLVSTLLCLPNQTHLTSS